MKASWKLVDVRKSVVPVGLMPAGRVAMPLTEAWVKVGSGPIGPRPNAACVHLRSKACESSVSRRERPRIPMHSQIVRFEVGEGESRRAAARRG